MTDRLKLFSLKPEAYKLENGETVYIRRFSAADRLDWIDFLSTQNPKTEIRDALNISARLLCLTLADESGNRLFKDGEESEIISLIGEKDFNNLAQTTVEANGIFAEAVEDVKKK